MTSKLKKYLVDIQTIVPAHFKIGSGGRHGFKQYLETVDDDFNQKKHLYFKIAASRIAFKQHRFICGCGCNDGHAEVLKAFLLEYEEFLKILYRSMVDDLLPNPVLVEDPDYFYNHFFDHYPIGQFVSVRKNHVRL